MQLKTLIVDDEILARKSMERLVNKNEHLKLVGVCANGKEGIAFLKEQDIDLILLDVEMPELDGFGLLEEVGTIPHIIITTTKEDYAFNAFEYQVDGYLKKPITIPKFNATIQKLVFEIDKKIERKTLDSESKDHIFLKVENKLVRIKFSELSYIENLGDYVKVVTTHDMYVVHSTMKSLEEKLPENHFMRIHRSYIINIGFIRDIEQNSIVISGKVIPVSRAAKPELLSKLNLL